MTKLGKILDKVGSTDIIVEDDYPVNTRIKKELINCAVAAKRFEEASQEVLLYFDLDTTTESKIDEITSILKRDYEDNFGVSLKNVQANYKEYVESISKPEFDKIVKVVKSKCNDKCTKDDIAKIGKEVTGNDLSPYDIDFVLDNM